MTTHTTFGTPCSSGEVFQLLQGKVDRYELKDQLAEHQATVRQLSDLEKQLKGAKDALLLKVDREEIEAGG